MASAVNRLLIADDHHLIRRGLRSLLETRPSFQVVAEAATGREALAAAHETTPDIAIVDYSLPELNGADLIVQLKRELPRIVVLVYTMHEREDVIMDVLQAGARGFVLKSDAETHLLAAVDALAANRPYFSGLVTETLLDRFLQSKPLTPPATLTHREREIVQLIAEGKINKQVADVLGITVKTVETHRANVMEKLHLKTTADLVRYAVRNRIIEA